MQIFHLDADHTEQTKRTMNQLETLEQFAACGRQKTKCNQCAREYLTQKIVF